MTQKAFPFLSFGLRELFLTTAVVGLCAAWWIDHRRQQSRLDLARLQVQHSESAGIGTAFSADGRPVRPDTPINLPNSFQSPSEFVPYLQTKSGDWNDLATKALGARQPPFCDEVVPAILPLLSDSDDRVQTRSALALGYMGKGADQAVPALISLLEDPSLDVQYHAASALAVLKHEAASAIPALRKIMLDDDSELAALAGQCISEIDPREELGTRFKQLLNNRHRRNRLHAIQELRYHLAPDEAEETLANAFRYEDDIVVREKIARTMNSLARRNP